MVAPSLGLTNNLYEADCQRRRLARAHENEIDGTMALGLGPLCDLVSYVTRGARHASRCRRLAAMAFLGCALTDILY